MPKVFDEIDDSLADWLISQPLFFVATAPLAGDGLINCSPKGSAGSFAVVSSTQVAYLDLTGSGIETIAHLRENGRIVVMFAAFDGRPRIVRLNGTGRAVVPGDAEFEALVTRFPEHPGIRSVVVVDVARISETCGYAVPRMDYVEDREVLDLANAKKSDQQLADYRRLKNSVSLDGLPGLPGLPAD